MPKDPVLDDFELPELDVGGFELPELDAGGLELPELDAAAFDLSKLDASALDLAKFDAALHDLSEFEASELPAFDPAAVELMMFDLKFPKLSGHVRKTLFETQLAIESRTLVPADALRVLRCQEKILKLRRGSKRSTRDQFARNAR